MVRRRPARATLVALGVGLACVAALFWRGLLLRDARTLVAFCALSAAGVCSLSAALCVTSRRPSARVLLAWATGTGAVVGLVWWVRVGLASLLGSGEADVVSAGALPGLDAVSPELRAALSGFAAGAVLFWGFASALGRARRRERRRRVELRRRAREA